MRVAVIGSEGQLGSDLVQVLSLSDRYEVVPFNHERLDVRQRDQVAALVTHDRFDTVVNCAAYTRVDDCEDQPAEAFLVNAQGAFEVARACAGSGALCVHISTDYVFGGDKGSPYSENDLAQPLNVYGASKLAGELLVRQAAGRWLIVRISSVFGKRGSRGKGGNFIETILSKARSNGRIQVVNDIWMSPSYTLDTARLLEELIRQEATGVFHAANSGRCTWFDFAEQAVRMAGLTAEVEPVSSSLYPTKARRPRDSSLSVNYLEKTLGRSIRRWEEGLKDYLVEKGHSRS
jgi:dTDP-4-dehydrorhamnose reductase